MAQKKTFENLSFIVAKDSPTDRIRRLVSVIKDVYTCRVGNDDSFEQFAERFRGHPQTYLNRCHSTQAIKNQKFAMIVLEYATRPTTPFNNIVGLLVSGANGGNNNKSIRYHIHEEELTALEIHGKKLKTDGEAYKILFEPIMETTEGATTRMTSINSMVN